MLVRNPPIWPPMLMKPDPEPLSFGGKSTIGIAQIAPTAMKSRSPARHCMTMKPVASATRVKPNSARRPQNTRMRRAW